MTRRIRKKDAVPFLLKAIKALRKPKDHVNTKPVFVAVVGGSASGKGHLIGELLTALNGPGMPEDHATVMSLDAYYLGAAGRAARGAPHHDHPAAVEHELAAERMASMRVGRMTMIPRYDFPTGERAGEETFTAKRFVLIDGLFALHAPEIRALCDYKIFVETDHYGAMLRRLFRDPGPDGRTKQSSREVLAQYFMEVWPSKKAFIDPTAAHADVIVESPYDASVEAVRAGHLQVQLKARGYRGDEHVSALAKAVRLGGNLRQIDRFMRPRAGNNDGELLRVRIENGEQSLTYKGPLMPNADGLGVRAVTSPIELPPDALRLWNFAADFETVATLKKTRTLFMTQDGILIARDRVDLLGDFFEVRSGDPSHAKRMRAILSALCPGETPTDANYLQLWRGASPAASP